MVVRPHVHATPAIAIGVLGLLAPASVPAQRAAWPTTAWETATPASQNVDGAAFSALANRVRGGEFGYVDRMLVIRNGFLIVDDTFPQDYHAISRGRRNDIGCGIDACDSAADVHEFNYLHPEYHPFYRGTPAHSLQSVTKSVSSTVVGVAIARGAIRDVHTNLLSYFEGDYDLSRLDPRVRSATLEDLLTMRTGIEWHEGDRPLNDTNTTIQLEKSPNWVQFTLNQPSDAAPGEKWVYNSGGSHLMSAVIRKATGRTIDDYAREYLFGPLGITGFHWKRAPEGLPDTEGGLYLDARQLAKIGLLYLNDGMWDGRRLLPEGWVAAATAIKATGVNGAAGYGYQWWRLDLDGTVVWAGLGFGGQYLVILPGRQAIGVINSWNIFGANSNAILRAFLTTLISATH